MDQTLKGHKGILSDVKFDATGIMASCSRTDGTVLIWNRNEPTEEEPHPRYTCINTLTPKVFALRHVRFSPCGEMIAVWGEDRLIRLINIHPGKTTNVGSVPWRFWPGIKCCETVVFLNQNQEKLLVYAYNNDQVRIWNYETKSVTALRDQERTVRAGDYDAYITAMTTVSIPNSDGGSTQQYLVVGCRVGMLKLWDLEDYTCVRSFSMGPGWSSVTNMTFTRDGSTLACTGEGSQIRVFDVESSRCVAVLNDNKGRVEGLIFCPDGQCLVSGACDRTVRMWNMATLMSSAS
jgi:WD40 repeat protein